MKHYKIYVEDKYPTKVKEILDVYFPSGYTIHSTVGYWKGNREKSIIIEIFCLFEETERIRFVCNELKTDLRQEAVLFTEEDIKGEFV